MLVRPAMKRLFCLKAKKGLGRFAPSALPHYNIVCGVGDIKLSGSLLCAGGVGRIKVRLAPVLYSYFDGCVDVWVEWSL